MLDDDFDAVVFFVAEFVVGLRTVFEADAIGDDEGRIDFTFENALEQRRHVALRVRLSHAKGKAFREGRAKGKLIEQTAIDSGHRNRSAFSARLDRLPKRIGPVGCQIRSGFNPVEIGGDRVPVGFETDRIDTDVRATPTGAVANLVEDAIDFVKVDALGSGLLRHLQAVRIMINAENPLGAEQERATNRHLSYGSRSPNRHGISRFDVSVFGRHVAGRENIA